MSFTPNIPASGQTLGNSRLQVLNNFASLRTTISNVTQPNHIDVNNVGAGKHIFVQMPVQVAGAPNLPAANEGGLITQTVAGNSELFYVRDAIATYLQMTGSVVPGNAGASVIFGGVRIQWINVVANDNTNIPFPVAFSANPWVIVGNEAGFTERDFVHPNITLPTSFLLRLTRIDGNPQLNPTTLYFIAIGPV